METPAVYTPDARTKEEQIARLTELAGCVEADILIRIAQAVLRARRLHPPRDYANAMEAAKSEALEWEAQAMRVEQRNGRLDLARLDRANKESLDVIATQYRLLARDFDFKPANRGTPDRKSQPAPANTLTPVVDTSGAWVGHIESGYARHALDAAAQGFQSRTCRVCGWAGTVTGYTWWVADDLCSECASDLAESK